MSVFTGRMPHDDREAEGGDRFCRSFGEKNPGEGAAPDSKLLKPTGKSREKDDYHV